MKKAFPSMCLYGDPRLGKSGLVSCFDSSIKLVHEPLRRLLEDGKIYACATMPLNPYYM